MRSFRASRTSLEWVLAFQAEQHCNFSCAFGPSAFIDYCMLRYTCTHMIHIFKTIINIR